ncbi:MAG: hypothetical protein HY927_13590 [Elusimicrobia bacterium]|nr:hypothetical protein [Elusimicrobiota bacterium]
MHLLNRYFAPFALFLVLSAVYFRGSDTPGQLPHEIKLSLGILALSFVVNWWLSSRTYRYVGWARFMRALQVWMNFVWSVPLFYLLGAFWGPMWLLFVMTPVTAALTMKWWTTLATALVSAATMMGIYFLRGLTPEMSEQFGMALVHAGFIVVISLFVHSLSQTALRLISPRGTQ